MKGTQTYSLSYYIIIFHNTSVPMIGHLELAIGMLTSYASMGTATRNVALKSDLSQMRLSRSRFDYERGAF